MANLKLLSYAAKTGDYEPAHRAFLNLQPRRIGLEDYIKMVKGDLTLILNFPLTPRLEVDLREAMNLYRLSRIPDSNA